MTRVIYVARCPACRIVWDTDERDGARVLAEHGDRVAPNSLQYSRIMTESAEELLAAVGRGDYEAADRAESHADAALAAWKAEHGRCAGSGTVVEGVPLDSDEGRALIAATIAENDKVSS